MFLCLLLCFCSVAIAALLAYIFEVRSLQTLFSAFYEIQQKSNIFSAIFRVEESSRNHGGQLVAEVLKAHDIRHVFTLCGGHISPILVSCEAKGIRVVDTRHEASAVFAADAVARLSQGIGVAVVTAGPGLTNTVTAIKNAQMAESPVLLLGGAAATLLKGRGALQDIDQMVLFRPLCKFSATVTRVRDIVPILRQALQAAKSGTPGPVFVEFPIDTLYPYRTVFNELGVKTDAKSFFQKLTNAYLTFHVSRLFGRAWIEQDSSPLPINFPKATHAQVISSADLVLKSERPVILIGSQSVLPPVKAEELKESVERLGIPCFLGGMARGLLGRNSKLHMRQRRKEALKEADLVILAGAVCDFRLGYGRVLNRNSKIIAVNRSASQLTKNSDMFWKPTLGLQADVGSFLVELGCELKNAGYNGAPSGWLNMLRLRDEEKEAQNLQMGKEKAGKHLNPVYVLEKLESSLPDDVILVADGGDFVATAAYTLRARGPLQWLDPGAFGTLGVGGGFALGAKMCFPEKPVWLLYGDGSCGYSIAEFDSFTRHKAAVTAVIGNDACWSQIEREQLPMFGTSVGCNLAYTPYETVGEGYGAVGMRVGEEDEEKLPEIFREAQRLNREGKSVVINVLIGKSTFREGSVSV